jgi:8-oxo-dGTP pyrophosphatase MutT (NUDIX family)
MTEPVARPSARVVPVNAAGQVLLLYGQDPARPREPYWFTIGGGLEPGESHEEAAVRELREETGIEVAISQLTPFHHGTHAYSFDGVRYLSASTFFVVRLCEVAVSFDGLQGDEAGNVFDSRWWLPGELTSGVPLSSPGLPAILERAVGVCRRPTLLGGSQPTEAAGQPLENA